MARARLLKPEFFTDEKLTALGPWTRLLFAGLWTIADKRGRLIDKPKGIEGNIFPDNKVAIDRLLRELNDAGLIVRYEIDGAKYIQVVNFERHQHVHMNEAESRIPPVPSTVQSTIQSTVHNPSEAKALYGSTDPEALNRDSGFEPDLSPDRPDEPEDKVGFVGEYVRHYRTRTGKDHPGAATVAACMEIERDYGFDACVQVAEDLDWQKPPNYMKPILEERKNGATTNGRVQTNRNTAGQRDYVNSGAAFAERLRRGSGG